MIGELESRLRRVVADEIGDYMSRAAADGRALPSEMDQQQMASAILRRELDQRSVAAMRHGEQPLTPDEEDLISDQVLETAFSVAPGLDRLLQRQDVTDIHVNGCDDVRLSLISGD